VELLRQYPAALMAAVWIAGLTAGTVLRTGEKTVGFLSALTLGIAGVLFILAKKHYRLRQYFLPFILISFFFGGWFYGVIRHPERMFEMIKRHLPPRVYTVEGQWEKEIPPTGYYRQWIARVTQINGGSLSFRILVKIPKDSNFIPDFRHKWRYMVDPGDWRPLPAPAHPYAFNYGAYLKHKGIYQVVRLKSPGRLQKTGTIQPGFFAGWRRKIRQNLRHDVQDSVHFQILAALLLGERQWLDKDLKKAFIRAGVMHVLAISGLHIGILLFFLRVLFSPLRKRKWLYNLAILSVLWFYAALTGFPPSVLRAVIMFSLFQIAWELERDITPWYIWLLAAFIILLIRPSALYDAGFLLSFGAVASILAFYPLLRRLYYPSSKILRYIIDLIYVSIAAQLGLVPLLLLIFHRFSFGFILANLVVIPLVSVILIIGFLMLPAWAAGISVKPVALILEKMLDFLYLLIDRIAGLRFLQFEHVYFDFYLAAALFLFIIGLKLWWKSRKLSWMVFIVAITALIVAADFYRINRRKEIFLGQIKYQPALWKLNGRNLHVYSLDSVPDYYLTPFRENAGIRTVQFHPYPFRFHAGGKSYLTLAGPHPDTTGLTPADALILTGSPKIHLEKVIEKVQPRTIIITTQNYRFLKNLWQKSARKYGIDLVDLSSEGYIWLIKEHP